jgi:hypothetical protein
MTVWEYFMRHLFGGLLFLCSLQVLAAPTVQTNESTGDVTAILNLDIAGSLYNVSFDQSFGSQLFLGDPATAEAAVDAINGELNESGYAALDNDHPEFIPLFYVYTDVATKAGFAGCDTRFIPGCNTSEGWQKISMMPPEPGLGDGSLGATYFTPALSIAIDVRPNNAGNKVFPNKSGKLPVALLSSAEFNAVQVNPASLKFGSGEAAITEVPDIEDVDGQFGADMVARFNVQDAGIFCGDSDVTLAGETYAGEPFASTDSIDASACQTGGCHAY